MTSFFHVSIGAFEWPKNDKMDIIRKRKSIRKYTDTNVNQEDVIKILDAAMCAPSAGNQRPWEFVVFRDLEMRQQLALAGPNAKMAAHAPVVILVLGNTNKEMHAGYYPVDCSAAVQNMLLQATELGIGSVWLGVYPRIERMQYLSELLDLPDFIKPFAMVCFGYAAEERPDRERFDESLIHYEHYTKKA